MFCLSVCLCVFYGHNKETRSLLLLDSWRAICDSYHGFYPRPENLFTLRTAEVKVSFRPEYI